MSEFKFSIYRCTKTSRLFENNIRGKSVNRNIDRGSGKKIQKKRDEVKTEDVVDVLNFANKVIRWHGTDRKWFSLTISQRDFNRKIETLW